MAQDQWHWEAEDVYHGNWPYSLTQLDTCELTLLERITRALEAAEMQGCENGRSEAEKEILGDFAINFDLKPADLPKDVEDAIEYITEKALANVVSKDDHEEALRDAFNDGVEALAKMLGTQRAAQLADKLYK